MSMIQRFTGVLLVVGLIGGCSSVSVRDTETAKINTDLGIAYLRQGNNDEALKKLTKALEQNPDNATAHNTIAVLFERLKEYEKADQHYQLAVELTPDDAQTHNNYGTFLCRRGRSEEAEREFMAAVKNPLYKTPEYAYTNAGLCAADQAKAESHFRQALKLNPRFSPALLQMAKLKAAQEQDLPARAYLQRFHEVAAPTPETLWLAVQVETRLGDLNAASSQALLLKSRFPQSDEAKKAQEQERDER